MFANAYLEPADFFFEDRIRPLRLYSIRLLKALGGSCRRANGIGGRTPPVILIRCKYLSVKQKGFLWHRFVICLVAWRHPDNTLYYVDTHGKARETKGETSSLSIACAKSTGCLASGVKRCQALPVASFMHCAVLVCVWPLTYPKTEPMSHSLSLTAILSAIIPQQYEGLLWSSDVNVRVALLFYRLNYSMRSVSQVLPLFYVNTVVTLVYSIVRSLPWSAEISTIVCYNRIQNHPAYISYRKWLGAWKLVLGGLVT